MQKKTYEYLIEIGQKVGVTASKVLSSKYQIKKTHGILIPKEIIFA